MEKLIKYLVEQIINKKAQVNSTQNESQTLIEIKIPQEKIGLVIGKEGRVIKAIRTLIEGKAARENLSSSWRIEVQPLLE